ncbi:MAG: hypothetical protein M0Z41_10695 [Peptococcaceae bacterium]|nr:hypothetical protein [Peptococcaceae bacterium]
MRTKEDVEKSVQELSREDQLWLLNRIVWRWWPQFQGRAVGLYDPAEVWDDWDDKELDEFYERKWKEAEERENRLQPGGCAHSRRTVHRRKQKEGPPRGGSEFLRP